MSLVRILNTDVHSLLVFAVSFLLCLVCFCLLLHAYRRKYQYRGKQSELQQPFIKNKRYSLSPRTSLLFGSKEFTNGLALTPENCARLQQRSIRSSPLNRPHVNIPAGNRTWPEGNFVREITTSMNQDQNRKVREPKMRKLFRKKKIKPRELFTSQSSHTHGKEKQVGDCEAEACNLLDRQNSSDDLHVQECENTLKAVTTKCKAEHQRKLKTNTSMSEHMPVTLQGEKRLIPMSTAEVKSKPCEVKCDELKTVNTGNTLTVKKASNFSEQCSSLLRNGGNSCTRDCQSNSVTTVNMNISSDPELTLKASTFYVSEHAPVAPEGEKQNLLLSSAEPKLYQVKWDETITLATVKTTSPRKAKGSPEQCPSLWGNGHSGKEQKCHNTSTPAKGLTGPKPELTANALELSDCKHIGPECQKHLSTDNKVKATIIELQKMIISVGISPKQKPRVSFKQRQAPWVHGCDSKKIVEKADGASRKTAPGDGEAVDETELVDLSWDNSDCFSGNSGSTESLDSLEQIMDVCFSSDNGIGKSERKRRSHRKKNVKSHDAKSHDKEPVTCNHKNSDANDVIAHASKSEVHCILCGITLSKPQCFYSLGSLCTDDDICETSSDDINRHLVSDVDVNPPVVEGQSHQDTGYTSSEDLETEGSLSKEVESDSSNDRREMDGYDGDHDSDSELDISLKSLVLSDEESLKPLISVGEPLTIIEYAQQEWKSETATSLAMKKGYGCISSLTGCQYLRQIRGDNFCAIRAVIFQALTRGLPILHRFGVGENKLEKIPGTLSSDGVTFLDQWSFANRLSVPHPKAISILEDFLAFFSYQVQKILDNPSQAERTATTLSLLNNETDEFRILEATKFLMFDVAVQLHKAMNCGEDVPIFAMLLFARDSCDTPRSLLINHLNRTGDTGGLEQVEMCLLGYTLGLVIKVIRPSQVDKEDFVAYYPSLDEVPKNAPYVTLVAEDDRHYNIVI